MMLESGLQSGLQSGILSGINAAFGGVTIDTVDPGDIEALPGVNPLFAMFRFGEASGATDLVGTNNLVDIGTPAKEVASASLGGLTTQLDDLDSSAMRAANNSVFDDSDESIRWIFVQEKHEASTNNSQNMVGKMQLSGGLRGYEMQANISNHITVVVADGSTMQSLIVAADHGLGNAEVIEFSRDHDADFMFVSTRLGTANSVAEMAGSSSNTGTFSIGKINGYHNSAPLRAGLLLIWHGANAEGMTDVRAKVAGLLGMD